MTQRIANINMLHQAGLAGMESRIRESFGITEPEYHDDLIFSAMIQAGVDRFRSPGMISRKVKSSDFLSSRIDEEPFDEIHTLISDVERGLYGEEGRVDDSKKDFALVWFLAELIYALKTRSAMVSILDTPSIHGHRGALNPKAMSALSMLFGKMEKLEVDSPISKMSVSSKDVNIFSELVLSDAFSNYVDAQSCFEDAAGEKNMIGQKVALKSRDIYKKFGFVVDVKKSPVSLIKISNSLIDSLFGGLYGKVADILANHLLEAMKENRRVTIYEYGKSHRRLLEQYYLEKAGAKKSR